MSIELLNGDRAGASDSLEELQTMVGSLEAQLMSLYGDRESDAADADEVAVYETKLGASADRVAELEAMVHSFDAQLQSLYADQRETPEDAQAMENLVAQLHSLYHEREHADDAQEMVTSLEAQVAALLEERNAIVAESAVKDAEAQKALARARDMMNAILEKTITIH